MKVAGLKRSKIRSYLKKCNISQAQVIRGIKSQGTYVKYEKGLILFRHIKLNSQHNIQLIQAINDHCDKFHDMEGSVITRPAPELKADDGDNEVEDEEDDYDDNDDDAHGYNPDDTDDNDDNDVDDEMGEGNIDGWDGLYKRDSNNEREQQQEKIKSPEENEAKTSFQASFISRLERVSPRLPSFNRNPSSWHLGSVGSDLLFPGLNENNH